MARPYSMDLRERVVASVKQEGQPRRQAADRFAVAISTAIHWIKRFEETGSAAPGQMGGHKPKTLAGAHADWLRQRCLDHPFTLRGLVRELAEERGLKVDYRSVWAFVHAEKLFFKKDADRCRAGPPRCRPPAPAMDEVSGAHRPRPPRLHRR